MNLTEMWAALERYQPHADKHGFGAEWLRMTTERTEQAASDAARAAWKARPQYYGAETAANCAADALKWAERTTREINEVIEKEGKE